MDHFKEAIDYLKFNLEIYCELQSEERNNELLNGVQASNKKIEHLIFLLGKEMYSTIDSELFSLIGEKWFQKKSDFIHYVESDTREILSDIEKKLAE